VLSLGAVFGLMVGWHGFSYLWTASVPFEGVCLVQVITLLLGACFVFGPMHSLGIIGMSRRVPEFADV
jgi:heme/copper-type cytochrome/quinol oxidase subunit 1